MGRYTGELLNQLILTRLGDKLQEKLPSEKLRHVTYLR